MLQIAVLESVVECSVKHNAKFATLLMQGCFMSSLVKINFS